MVCLRNEVGPFYEELLFKAGDQQQQQQPGMVAVVAIGQPLQHQQSI